MSPSSPPSNVSAVSGARLPVAVIVSAPAEPEHDQALDRGRIQPGAVPGATVLASVPFATTSIASPPAVPL